MKSLLSGVAWVALLLALGGADVRGQTSPRWDGTGLQLTRVQLQEALARYESAAESGVYSGAMRGQAEREAALIRTRLLEGDLRVGDRVLLSVEGHPALSDTFNVVTGRALVLPDIGQIPLQGVLRSELRDHLQVQLERFIRDPVVQARALVRIEILGAVTRPGFYPVPSDLLLTDVLMLAGGPTSAARLDRIEIRRHTETIWPASRLREAVIEGHTLDQLSVRAGDAIHVGHNAAPALNTARDVLFIISGLGGLLLVAGQLGAF